MFLLGYMNNRVRKTDLRLVVRYVTKECTSSERKEVEARLAVDEKFSRLHDEVSLIWQPASQVRPVDIEAALSKVKANLAEMESAAETGRMPVMRKLRHDEWRRADRPALRVARTDASRRHRRLLDRILLYVAFFVVVGLSYLAGGRMPSPVADSEPERELVFATERGQRSTVQLADGTRITLAPLSRITLSPTFYQGERRVKLTGEALFDVATDSLNPFIVDLDQASVTVLGTVFDVRAFEEDQEVKVSVVEGAVAFKSHGAVRDTVVLRRNHIGSLRNGALSVRAQADLAAYLAWTEGRLVFEKAPFDLVERELERWYNIEVNLEADPRKVDLLTVSFKDEPLGEVLNVIASTLRLEYRRDQRYIEFFPSRNLSHLPEKENTSYGGDSPNNNE